MLITQLRQAACGLKKWRTRKGDPLRKIAFADRKAVFVGIERADEVLRRTADNIWLDEKRGKEARVAYKAMRCPRPCQ